jgi:predicted DNA-binding protein
MNITRATFTIDLGLLERLRLFAKEEKRPISDVVEEGIQKVISEQEAKRLDRMYAALDKLEGIGDLDITDASTTIDEVLYGENGAWKGSRDQL